MASSLFRKRSFFLTWLSLFYSTQALSSTISTTTALSPTASDTLQNNPRCNTSDPTVSTYVPSANETCVDISAAANVSTSTLANINALGANCNYLTANQTLCLPKVCDIYLVQSNDTCTSILSSLTRQISLPIFRSWNPSINALCSNFDALVGGYICLR